MNINIAGWSISFKSIDLATGHIEIHALGMIGGHTVNVHLIKPVEGDLSKTEFSIEIWEGLTREKEST